MIDTNKIQHVAQPPAQAEVRAVPPYRGRRRVFIGAVAFQVALLLGLGYQPMVTLASGKVVTFKTIPVDPWDMFRGDYVVLSYAFNDILTPGVFERGQKVYAVVRKDSSGDWQAVKVAAQPPAIGNDEIMLAGRVESIRGGSVRVKYGIEQAFVAEGAGRQVQSGHDVVADVAVDAKGCAVIKEVRHNKDILYRWRLM